jgi:hypothetical protein
MTGKVAILYDATMALERSSSMQDPCSTRSGRRRVPSSTPTAQVPTGW